MMPVQACEPWCLICPRCNQPLRVISASDGSFVARCPNRTLVSNAHGGHTTERCDQPVHVAGTREGVAYVLPITSEIYNAVLERHLSANEVYRKMGVIESHQLRS